MFGGAIQESLKGFHEFRLVQQKGIVARVGIDLHETDICGDPIQGMHDLATFGRREKPVAGERDDTEANFA